MSIASYHGKIECARFLLERGADMSLKHDNGKTAKDWAVQQGKVDIANLLNEVSMLQNSRSITQISSYLIDLTCLLFIKYEAKKQNTPQAQQMTEAQLPQVLGELVMEPINKALQEENGRLKIENGVLKERELSKNKEILLKQELVDEYKARSKSVE